MAQRFQRNSRGFEELLKAEFIRADMTSRAERMAEAARADAAERAFDNGDYHDSIAVVQRTTDRAVASVVATDWKAHILEARLGIMARAKDAAGGE